VARLGDVFVLGRHRVVCGDARDPAVLVALLGAERARLLLTDEPYSVPIRWHMTGGAHQEFAMASGEMSDAEFRAFNLAWIGAVLPTSSRSACSVLSSTGVDCTWFNMRRLSWVCHR
jgi:hypothetical protein